MKTEAEAEVAFPAHHPVSLSPLASPELDRALSLARVVMLGEQSHGDGAAFSAKAALVRHLHLNHGFDVLAFEACFYSLARTWQEHRNADGLSRHIARQIYGHWRNSREMTPLWKLLDNRAGSQRPLTVAGIDPRHAGPCSQKHLIGDLEKLLAEQLPNELETDDFARFRKLLEGILEHEYRHKVSAIERSHFMDTIWRLKRQLAHHNGGKRGLWQQELKNIAYFARNAWSFEGRDRGMADNLLWLSQIRYPDKKIIVWTHNWHAVKSSSTVSGVDRSYRDTLDKYPDRPLGEVTTQALGKDLFCLALVAGCGTELPLAYRGDYHSEQPLLDPPVDSLEAHLLTKKTDAAFLNLRNQPSKFKLSGLEPGHWLTLNWNNVFDGILFLRHMRPLTT